MRFLMLVKHAENVAMSGAPPPKFMEEMAKLSEGAANSGGLIASGGLAPTAASTRIRLSQGKVTALDGPFTESKEIVGGFAMFELKSKQEAIDGATQFMELHKNFWPGWEGETEVRQIFGPEDLPPKS